VLRFNGVGFIVCKPPATILFSTPSGVFWDPKEESLWIGGSNGFAQVTAIGIFRMYHRLDGLEVETLVDN
jgi:hypothetical protein